MTSNVKDGTWSLRRRPLKFVTVAGLSVLLMATAPGGSATAAPSSTTSGKVVAAALPPDLVGGGSTSAPITIGSEGSTLAAAGVCAAVTRGDYVHVTYGQASGHGWWERGTCTATQADVTVQLQQYFSDGSWRNSGSPGTRRIAPNQTSTRANARVTCASTATTGWRSVVDVDIVGVIDDATKLTTPGQNIGCRA